MKTDKVVDIVGEAIGLASNCHSARWKAIDRERTTVIGHCVAWRWRFTIANSPFVVRKGHMT